MGSQPQIILHPLPQPQPHQQHSPNPGHVSMPPVLCNPVPATDHSAATGPNHFIDRPGRGNPAIRAQSPQKTQTERATIPWRDLLFNEPVTELLAPASPRQAHVTPMQLPPVAPVEEPLRPIEALPLRRSTRERNQVRTYDAATGKSAKPSAVDDNI